MTTSALTPQGRQHAIDTMAGPDELDILVIGSGVTGSGAALDAATRGLRTGLIEARDYASGTSSRSSKLIHGGLRYLEMMDFRLVNEALQERGLLLSRLAPHLVRPARRLCRGARKQGPSSHGRTDRRPGRGHRLPPAGRAGHRGPGTRHGERTSV